MLELEGEVFAHVACSCSWQDSSCLIVEAVSVSVFLVGLELSVAVVVVLV